MNKKINEGFSDALDSSLVDYSDDMKKSDINYKLKTISTWIEDHIWFSNKSKLKNPEALHDLYELKMKNDVPTLILKANSIIIEDGVVRFNLEFSNKDANQIIDIPFKLELEDPNLKIIIGLYSFVYNSKIKIKVKDLRFIENIPSKNIEELKLDDVYLDDFSYLPSIWDISHNEGLYNNLFYIEHLDSWKNTDFIFDANIDHGNYRYLIDVKMGNDYENCFGFLNIAIKPVTTYEALFKSILENINSSVIDESKYIYIDLRELPSLPKSFSSTLNLFKINGKKVLIAYDVNTKTYQVGGTWGTTHYFHEEIPFILENGELKQVKINWNDKTLEYKEANPIKRIIGESFVDALDSSLIDYTSDFENADKKYEERLKIEEWLLTYINPNSYYFNLDIDDKNYKQELLKRITIHDDNTVSLHINKSMNCNFIVEKDDEYENWAIHLPFDIPEYINFNYVLNGFSCENISEKSMIELKRWFPKKLKKDSSWSSNDPYRIWDSHENKNLILSHLDFFKQLAIDNNTDIDIYLTDPYDGHRDVYYITKDGTITSPLLDESFSNALDSSLMDYSSDFANKDKEYLEEYPVHYPEIYNWLKSMDLIGPDYDNIPRKYWINENGTIDASGCIDIELHNDISIPKFIQFNEVWGSFHISFVDNLQKSKFNPRWRADGPLAFGPKIVHGDFWVSYCNNLQTLKGCPEIIDGDFICMHNTDLCTFKYFPKKVGGKFTYYGNALSLYCKDYSGSRGIPLPGEPEKGPLYGAGWTEEKVRNTFDIDGEIDGGYFAKEK